MHLPYGPRGSFWFNSSFLLLFCQAAISPLTRIHKKRYPHLSSFFLSPPPSWKSFHLYQPTPYLENNFFMIWGSQPFWTWVHVGTCHLKHLILTYSHLNPSFFSSSFSHNLNKPIRLFLNQTNELSPPSHITHLSLFHEPISLISSFIFPSLLLSATHLSVFFLISLHKHCPLLHHHLTSFLFASPFPTIPIYSTLTNPIPTTETRLSHFPFIIIFNITHHHHHHHPTPPPGNNHPDKKDSFSSLTWWRYHYLLWRWVFQPLH